MHGPALSGWLLVALCAATGVYCLLRTRVCDGEERRAAVGEAVMGFGMAAMALPAAVLTPPEWGWTLYAAVFGAATLHGLLAVRHGGHHLHHLVGSLAMVYMAVAMAAPGAAGAHAGHAAGTAGGIPVLTGGLLLYYVAYVLRSGARLVPVAATAGSGTGAARTTAGSGTGAVRTTSGSGTGAARTTSGGGGRAWATRPELAHACRLSMALAMLAMLVTL
ncbi:DUF5134 domain-containing protein [Streptomyces sp. TLI_105]|uniref:DUF5134 domain-containing protein n=1 Tax=Streptomyces sp. TLI_105 TaxID=1881019 RepID=UPI000899489F|nr:DUF5134 domain-containing protein [Streptomyces sp. TLI_105]SED87562.1 protein of unknown function [Streptomyces sp. TLI_105]